MSEVKLGMVAGEQPEALPGEPWPPATLGGIPFPSESIRSRRTRWLAFLNDRGKLVYAPAVRTFQLALVAGMGQEWYWKAMAFSVDP